MEPTEYEFDDPSKWAKDPGGRSLHALHVETDDVVSLDEATYKALFPTRKKRANAPAVTSEPEAAATAETGDAAGEGEETEPLEDENPPASESEGAELTA